MTTTKKEDKQTNKHSIHQSKQSKILSKVHEKLAIDMQYSVFIDWLITKNIWTAISKNK